MVRVFAKSDLLALDEDERHDYSAMLTVRLTDPQHQCKLGFNPAGEGLCQLCGCELPDDYGSEGAEE